MRPEGRGALRVGFLGPEGTFSHEALLAAAGAVDDLEPVALGSTHDVVLAVQDGRVARAIAPVENSLEGEVTPVADALAHDAPDVVLTGEHVLRVRLCVVAAAPVDPRALRLVLSHPQPLGQCAGWLRDHAPGARTAATASTVEAVRTMLALPGADGPAAAIAPRAAAERHGAVVLARDVADEPGNATRFVWLARRDGAGPAPFPAPAAADPDEAWRTALLFDGAGDGTAGWLVDRLAEFASRGVNLTRIASRPSRRRLGHYVFHVDLDGRWDDGPEAGRVAAAVAALRPHCEHVRVLGTWPRAAPPGA